MAKGQAYAASRNLPLQAVSRLEFSYVMVFHASWRLHWESGTVLSNLIRSVIRRPGGRAQARTQDSGPGHVPDPGPGTRARARVLGPVPEPGIGPWARGPGLGPGVGLGSWARALGREDIPSDPGTQGPWTSAAFEKK